MCVSAAVLKQVSKSKIVHVSVTKSCQVRGWLGQGDTHDVGGFNPCTVPQPSKVTSFPPVEVDPNKVFENGEI